MLKQGFGQIGRRIAIGCLSASAFCLLGAPLALYYVAERIEQARQAGAAKHVREQIADFNSGAQSSIYLTNEGSDYEFAAFIEFQEELGAAHPYELVIWYSHNVDDLLAQMENIRGVRKLVLYKTDVSDAGLEYLTTMPELAEVRIGRNLRTAVTDEKLAELRARMPQCTFEIGDDQ